MRGSILGVGTDVGGSIRVPAMCNGLYGIKPSHGRVPYAGQEGGVQPGSSKLAIEATAGPIAHSMRDCELFLRAVGGDREPYLPVRGWSLDSSGRHSVNDTLPQLLDPDVIAQTWDQQASLYIQEQPCMPESNPRMKQPLRIGVVRTDGHTTPLPPVQRLMDEVTQALRASGGEGSTPIEIVELDLFSLLSQCVKVSNGIFSLDGANQWFDLLEKTGEPLSPWLQGRLRRRPQKTVNEIRTLQAQKIEMQTKFLSVWWDKGGYWNGGTVRSSVDQTLDIIICPAAPHPVPPIDRWNTVNYTSAFNLLDLPAGILPVRAVTQRDLEAELGSAKPLNGWDKTNQELWTKVRRQDYLGTMLSVQVVAPRLMERKLVESMAIVDEALKPLKMNETTRSSKL